MAMSKVSRQRPVAFEVDGIDARLVVEGQSVGADDAGTDQQQRASLMGILVRGDLVVEFEGLVEGGGLSEIEGIEGDAGEGLRATCFSQYSRRSFSSVYLMITRQSLAFRADVRGVDRAGEGAVGGEGEGAFAHRCRWCRDRGRGGQ